MLNLKVGEISCKIPNQWDEMILKDYSKIYAIIKQNQFVEPSEDDMPSSESEVKALDSQRNLHNVKLNRSIFCELTGIDKETINRVDANEMANTLVLMTNFLNGEIEKKEIEESVKYSFDFKNKKYFFPIAEMKKSTFGDYIEAAQLDMLAENNEAGKFGVIAEQMAILCREEGEEYNEEKVIVKTKLFQNLKMDVVWDFIFFLNTQIKICNQHSQMFLKTATEMKTDTQQVTG